MQALSKPAKLGFGDKVVLITLSDAEAYTNHWRYLSAKSGLQKLGLEVVESKYALRSPHWIYENPQARAEDLMESFQDKSIKAIMAICGGEDSIRLLKHIDFNVITSNPKIFVGYSDITTIHYMCLKAGLSSFYGPMVMSFDTSMHWYTQSSFIKTLFSPETIGEIKPISNNDETNNWRFISGKSNINGRLIGGCVEVLPFLYGTEIWPNKETFTDGILFIETVTDTISARDQHGFARITALEWFLRNLGTQGILERLNAILFSKPGIGNNPVNPAVAFAGDRAIIKILREFGREDMPVITNMDFGHKSAIMTMPYGCLAEINVDDKKLTFVESAVQ